MVTGSLQILTDYKAAFDAGDLVTSNEILQFAKHDAALSEQLLALEDRLLASAPAFDVDIEHLVSKVNHGGILHRARDLLEAWIGDHAADIRASIRLFPFAAAIAFGVCLYLLGAGARPPLSWWLAVGAALCIGSIAVICTSSLWRPYPRIPESSHIRSSTKVEDKPGKPRNNDLRSGASVVVVRQRRVTTAVWGLPVAASVAVLAFIVLQRPPLNDDYLVNQNGHLIGTGEFTTTEFVAVPLSFDLTQQPDEARFQSFTITARLEDTEFDAPWSLSVIDSNGALIGTSRGDKEGAALVKLSGQPATIDERWVVAIQLGRLSNIESQYPLEWSLYSGGVHTTFVEAEKPLAVDSEETLGSLEFLREQLQVEQKTSIQSSDSAKPDDGETKSDHER